MRTTSPSSPSSATHSPKVQGQSPSRSSVLSSNEAGPSDGQSGQSTPKINSVKKIKLQSSKGSLAMRLGTNWLFGALGGRSQPSFPAAAAETVARSDVSSVTGVTGRPPSPIVSLKSPSQPLAVPGAVSIIPSTPSPAKDKTSTQPLPIHSTRIASDNGISGSFRNHSVPRLSRSPGDSWGRSANLGRASRHVTVNPCNPKVNDFDGIGEGRRWQHIRPRSTKDNQHLVKWTSLCAPACLPLTTDYLPTTEEVAEFYSVNNYEIACVGEGSSFLVRNDTAKGSFVLATMREMASQRLARGSDKYAKK